MASQRMDIGTVWSMTGRRVARAGRLAEYYQRIPEGVRALIFTVLEAVGDYKWVTRDVRVGYVLDRMGYLLDVKYANGEEASVLLDFDDSILNLSFEAARAYFQQEFAYITIAVPRASPRDVARRARGRYT